MDLKKLMDWAIETNNPEKVKKLLLKSDPDGKNLKYLTKVLSYLGMIINKGNAVFEMQRKLNGYLDDISEYAGHLDKRGFRYAEEGKAETSDQMKTGVLPDGEHSEEGKQEPAKSEEIL